MLRKNLFRTLCGSALALAWVIGCGDDGSSGGGGGSGGDTSTGGTSSATGGTASGTGGNSATGGNNNATGGDAGGGGDCESGEDVLPLGLYTPSMGGMGGMGGGAGDDGPFGWNFAEEDDVEQWGVDAGDTDTEVTFNCGSILVDVDWPEEANESYVSTYLKALAPGDQRWNLEGQTVSVDVRWNSGGVPMGADGGFDVYIGVYSGFGDTWELRANEWSMDPDAVNMIGEVTAISEDYTTVTFEVPEADGTFDPTIIRMVEIRLSAKVWNDNHDYQPTQFEIDSFTWE